MNLVKLGTLAILISFGTATADENVERKMAVNVVLDGDGSGDSSTVHWSTDAMDFDLQELAIGETRVVDSESGQPVTVTRGEDGFTLDIGGQSVALPDFDQHAAHMAVGGTGDAEHDINIEVFEDHAIGSHRAEGVTIISAKPLDASVRESIKSVLMSAGNDDEVTFIDTSQDAQRVMVMKKKVEIVQ